MEVAGNKTHSGLTAAKTFDKVQAVQNVIIFRGGRGIMDFLNSSRAAKYRPGGQTMCRKLTDFINGCSYLFHVSSCSGVPEASQ